MRWLLGCASATTGGMNDPGQDDAIAVSQVRLIDAAERPA